MYTSLVLCNFMSGSKVAHSSLGTRPVVDGNVKCFIFMVLCCLMLQDVLVRYSAKLLWKRCWQICSHRFLMSPSYKSGRLLLIVLHFALKGTTTVASSSASSQVCNYCASKWSLTLSTWNNYTVLCDSWCKDTVSNVWLEWQWCSCALVGSNPLFLHSPYRIAMG